MRRCSSSCTPSMSSRPAALPTLLPSAPTVRPPPLRCDGTRSDNMILGARRGASGEAVASNAAEAPPALDRHGRAGHAAPDPGVASPHTFFLALTYADQRCSAEIPVPAPAACAPSVCHRRRSGMSSPYRRFLSYLVWPSAYAGYRADGRRAAGLPAHALDGRCAAGAGGALARRWLPSNPGTWCASPR